MRPVRVGPKPPFKASNAPRVCRLCGGRPARVRRAKADLALCDSCAATVRSAT